MSDPVKYVLDESRLPEAWYNIAADLPAPPPPVLHPGTGQPVGPDDLAPLFPMQIILQEVSTDRLVAIPEEVRTVYRQWRPTPLYRARRLEAALETPARIYYKYEGVSPTGSHKPNTAVAQAYYNKAEGVTRLTTETGAGQWGSALAFAGGIFGLEVDVWMVKVSYDQKPYRRGLIEAFGGARRREPVGGDERGPRDPRGAPGLHGQPRDRDLRGRRGRRAARGHEVLARLGLEPRPHAPDRDRRGGADAARGGRGLPGRRDRLHGRRLELLGPLVPVHRPGPARRGEDPRDRGRAGRLPEPHEGALRLRLRRHGPSDAARQDAHARLDVRARRRSMRAGCATTAWRRSSAICTSSG